MVQSIHMGTKPKIGEYWRKRCFLCYGQLLFYKCAYANNKTNCYVNTNMLKDKLDLTTKTNKI